VLQNCLVLLALHLVAPWVHSLLHINIVSQGTLINPDAVHPPAPCCLTSPLLQTSSGEYLQAGLVFDAPPLIA